MLKTTRGLSAFCVVSALVATAALGAGSGPLWYRYSCGETNFYPQLRVDAPGPLTITVSTRALQGPGTLDLSLIDQNGVTVFAQHFAFPQGFSTSTVTPSVAAGTYTLKPLGSFYDFFRFSTSAAAFVWPSCIDFLGQSWDQIDAAGSYYFYVPINTTSFAFRLQVPDPYEHGQATVFAPDGTERGSLVLTGTADQTRTVNVDNASAGFWRVYLTNDASDIRFHLSGIPPFIAESPGAWFDPTGATVVACSFSLDTGSTLAVSAAAGSRNLTLNGSPEGCRGDWTASSSATWLTVSPAAGNGSGLLTMSWTKNSSLSSRSAVVMIAGRGLTVTQDGGAVPSVKGDFNGDDRADILWRNESSGANGIWFMNGIVISGTAMIPSASPPWKLAAAADLDGDGNTDLIWRDDTTGQNVIWFMVGAMTAAGNYFPSAAPEWAIVGAGDFNGDGRADILWRNYSTGANGIWFMRGASVLGSALITGADPAWSIAGVADLNNDDSADIVWRNYTTGQNGVWFMNGTTPTASAFFPSADPAWRLEGLGDFDGNRKVDLVWRNPATGQNVMWLLDGTTVVSASYITSAGLEWSIRGPR